jgi:hypothetical protein
MAITEYKAGSATIGVTEYSLVTPGTTLASDTTDGVFQVFIDFSTLASGDEYQIAVKEKTTSGGSQGVIFRATVAGVQGSPIWVSPSLILMHGWDVTVDKIAGTDRSISWSIRQVA